MPDYIPRNDADFDNWQVNLMNYVNFNGPALGLTPADLAPSQVEQAVWTPAYPLHLTSQNTAQADRAAKDAAREAYEDALRTMVAKIQAEPSVTNAQKALMQITQTGGGSPPAPPVGSRPLLAVDTAARLHHTISWVDEISGKKAKPPGIKAAEIWIKIGDPAPIGPDGMTFLVLDTASPYDLDFDQADGGKRAHYLARWQKTDGTFLTWSELASATIPA